jgi:hypothetical protein
MKKTTILSLFLLLCANLFAIDKEQNIPQLSLGNKIINENFLAHSSVGINLGTIGAGLSYRTSIGKRVFGRAGFSVLPASYKMPFTINGLSTTANLSASFSNLSLFGEYQVFERIGLRLVGGLSYFVQGNVKAALTPKASYTIENVTYSPSDIGQLELNIDWKGLAPYVGLGFGMPIPESKFNIGMDLGLFYLSQPTVSVTGTGRLQDNAAMATQLNKNLSDYRIYPMFQLSFNYKLN